MFRRKPKQFETEKQYMAKVGCLNCDNVQSIMIDKGKLVEIFCHDSKIKCGFCQCLDSLQPYFAYQSMKKMLQSMGGMLKPAELAGGDEHHNKFYG